MESTRAFVHSMHHLLPLLLLLSLLILAASARLLPEESTSLVPSAGVKFTEEESITASSSAGLHSQRMLHDVPSGPNPIGNMLPGKYLVQRSPPDPEPEVHYDP